MVIKAKVNCIYQRERECSGFLLHKKGPPVYVVLTIGNIIYGLGKGEAGRSLYMRDTNNGNGSPGLGDKGKETCDVSLYFLAGFPV